MPRVIDKIIINGNTIDGSYQAIKAEFATLSTLAKEVEDAGLGFSDENKAFLTELQSLCTVHNAAHSAYLAGVQALRDKIAAFIDSQPAPAAKP